MRRVIFFTLMACVIFACKQEPKELRTKSGYKYDHVKVGKESPKPGEWVHFTLKYITNTGKVVQEYTEGPNMPNLQIPKEGAQMNRPNPLLDMLALGAVGDSMSLIVPMDSMPGSRQNPNLSGAEHVEYITCIKDIKTEAEQSDFVQNRRLAQEKKEDEDKARYSDVENTMKQALKDYKAGKLEVNETEEGLKYVVLEEGDGLQVKTGMRASVHYFGTLMDGKMFDTSFRTGKPYGFTVGQRRVIQGWDLGLPQYKVGSKGLLVIPHELGYGVAGSPPNIPGESELAFYIEVVDAN